MGSRQLRTWLHEPLRGREGPTRRALAVDALTKRSGAATHADHLRARLEGTVDVDRIAARIALRSARPRDLAGLCDTLAKLGSVRAALADANAAATADDAFAVAPADDLIARADRVARDAPTKRPTCSLRAIQSAPAAMIRDGGVIADGFDASLDELRALASDAGTFLVALEARERARTGIANLRVEYNRVHGYFIEITSAAQSDRGAR